jgi:tight adherence protein B
MLSSVAAPILLLLFGAAALIGAYMAARRRQEEVDRRVELVVSVNPATAHDSWLSSQSKKLDQAMRSIFAAGAPRSWGMKSGALKLILVAAVAALAAWLLTHVALGMPFWIAAPLTAASGYLLPRLLLRREQAQTENAFQEMFPDTVDTVARMLRAGIPISAAVRSIGSEAVAPISTVFGRIADQVEIGARIEEALDTASRQVGLADFRFFAVAITLQYATGGNLVSTLDILSNIIRRRRAVRLKAGAATAEIRVSAYVLGSLPLLIIGGLLLVQPGYLSPLFTDRRGHIILGIAVGGMLFAFLTMRQMMRGVTANV